MHRWYGLFFTAAILFSFTSGHCQQERGTIEASEKRSTAPNSEEAKVVFFQQHVLPLLKEHCYPCHSHETEFSGNLALDYASGWKTGGDRGPAIVPGKPDSSLLMQFVRGEIKDLRMPPEEPLRQDQIEILRTWIEQGAIDPRETVSKSSEDKNSWWSLQPIQTAIPPIDVSTPAAGSSLAEPANPIDTWIDHALASKGIRGVPLANRRSLLRRLSIDLHGLLPTPEELANFEKDDSLHAYEKVVDRLLASPRYGERWARHWLDWIHFADSHGFEHDVMRPNAWHYRDYVIDSLNRDVPWPQWIRQQIAADGFYPDHPELTPALGFLAAGPWDQSTAATAQTTFDYIDRDDMVTQTMSVLTSTTVHCARCHNHKFDPISQADYYALQSIFAGVGRGNVPFDSDSQVGQQRLEARRLLQASKSRDKSILLSSSLETEVAAWENQVGSTSPQWSTFTSEMLIATEGSELKSVADNKIQATGPRPATETCIITGHASLSKVTGLRLEVFRDEMLPMSGPGRNDNGNFHLSEVIIEHYPEGVATAIKIPIAQAAADFNQSDWTISHAIDGNPSTAWGIFPEVGKDHVAVFQFAKPLAIKERDRLVVHLRQLHGGFHTIGNFRITLTDQDSPCSDLLPKAVQDALQVPKEQRSETQQLDLNAFVAEQKAAAILKSLPSPVHVYAAAANFESLPQSEFYKPWMTPKKVFNLRRGDIDKPMDEALPGALTCLSHSPSRFELPNNKQEVARRMAFAEWITHEENPLFWRSIVNRIWQHHFGRGLVDTPNDFGRMGSLPSHPELLDWLASELRRSGGSLKSLHRQILLSRAYQRSSAIDPQATAIDPDNRLIWRASIRRIDAESYRDSLLHLANAADRSMGGPAVQWFRLGPAIQVTPSVDYSNYDWNQAAGNRRTIYRFVYRGMQDPFMEALDFPDAAQLTPTRSFSASPLQALALWNHDFVLYACKKLEQRIESQANVDQVQYAFELIYLRAPSAEEYQAAKKYHEQYGLAALLRIMINSSEFLFCD